MEDYNNNIRAILHIHLVIYVILVLPGTSLMSVAVFSLVEQGQSFRTTGRLRTVAHSLMRILQVVILFEIN